MKDQLPQPRSCGTHDGTFHADEVTACALLILFDLVDEDKVLLYYGDHSRENIESWFEQISNDACIYSYTCPERGTPPPESCGLTCEL